MKEKLRKSDTEQKSIDETLGKSNQCFKLKLKNNPLHSKKTDNLELTDIIDIQAVQSIMDDFYKFAHITMALLDLKGNVLVGVGWQDICTKFHRVHSETCKHCVESDTKLSAGVPLGEFKLYKCKNNMWDVVTPIVVEGQHIGNIFSGQFFFEDEPLDYELFRAQARQYGFNEEEYIAALEKVPRLSRDTVENSMSFFMKLANMLSQLSHSNIKLAQSLDERNDLVEALQESEKRERVRLEELEAVLDAVPVAVFITHDPQVRQLTGNRLSYEWLRVPVDTNFSKSVPEGEKPEFFKLFKNGKEIPPEKMPSQMAAAGREVNDCELDIVSADGDIRHVLGNARPLRDEQGNLQGSVSAFVDITERKRAEQALKKVHQNLEEKVKERTAELEKAYNSLKETERGLAEAQKIAHIGNWDWDLISGEVYWSDELYRIFGRDPKKLAPSYKEYLNYIHPDDRAYFDSIVRKPDNDKPHGLDHRIILDNEEERIVNIQAEVVFDERNVPIRVKGIVQDITERKNAEKAIRNLELIRKKEIHHRIKNNLQVISSLLDLQAEKFGNREFIMNSEVLEAFRESQDRVTSIALIHEELHEEEGTTDTLNFSLYLQRLVESLFQTYRFENTDISLNLSLEENVFFDMDTAVPLGMIVNELVSNSLKYAFSGRKTGEIQIKLFREEIRNELNSKVELTEKNMKYSLVVSDNGVGISEKINFEDSDTLGLQLVNLLVDQLEGTLELRRDNGTEFMIQFNIMET